MALSIDSKMKDIMRSPEGSEVLEKWAPGSTKDPRMKLVGGLTYRKLLSFPSQPLWLHIWMKSMPTSRLVPDSSGTKYEYWPCIPLTGSSLLLVRGIFVLLLRVLSLFHTLFKI